MAFVKYVGAHPNKSSDIDILPELNLLRKTKAERSEKSLLTEYVALISWFMMLSHYDTGEADSNIHSPYPVAFDPDERSLTMSFVGGFILPLALTGDHELRELCIPKKDVRTGIAFGLGRLAAIKQREGVLHGDYDVRHVLYDPLGTPDRVQTPRVGIIDLESTKAGVDKEAIAQEDEILRLWLQRALSSRLGGFAAAAYDEGLHSLEPGEPVWQDAVYTALDEAGISRADFGSM